jgi:hypothetical protein
MKKSSLAGLLLALVGMGLVWFGASPHGSEHAPLQFDVNQPLGSAGVASETIENEPSKDYRSPVSDESGLSAIDQLDRVSNTQNLYADLLARANRGDTSAMHALTILATRCSSFTSRYGARVHPRNELTRTSMDEAGRGVREQALQMMTQYCAGGFAPGELSDLAKELDLRLSVAAKDGDLSARAARFFDGEPEVAVLDVIRGAKDPWIVEAALYRLSADNGPLVRDVSNRVFPSDMLLTRGEEVAFIREMAASWRGCQLGRPCGANQFDALQMCAIEGNCNMGRDVRAIIQQRELSGRQFELMQRYLAALDAEVRRGR